MSQQWSVREDHSDRMRLIAKNIGIPPTDYLDVLISSEIAEVGGERAAASHLLARWNALAMAETPTTPLLEIDVDEEVLVTRLGPTVCDDAKSPGYHRHHIGAELTDGPPRVWEATRGYWNIRPPLPAYLAATRLGVVLGVWRIHLDQWTQTEDGKWYALGGEYLDSANRRAIQMPNDPPARPCLASDDDDAGTQDQPWQRGLRSEALDDPALAVVNALARGTLVGYPSGTPKSRYRLGPAAASQRRAIAKYRDRKAHP